METVKSIQDRLAKEQWRKDNYVGQLSFNSIEQAKIFEEEIGHYLFFYGVVYEVSLIYHKETGNVSIHFFSEDKVCKEKILFALAVGRCLRIADNT